VYWYFVSSLDVVFDHIGESQFISFLVEEIGELFA